MVVALGQDGDAAKTRSGDARDVMGWPPVPSGDGGETRWGWRRDEMGFLADRDRVGARTGWGGLAWSLVGGTEQAGAIDGTSRGGEGCEMVRRAIRDEVGQGTRSGRARYEMGKRG